MLSPPVITRATLDNAAAIVALEQRCFDPVDRFPLRSWRYLLAPARSAVPLERSSAPIFIAQENKPTNNHVVGCISVLLRQNSVVARIYSLAVDPSMRGRGLGAQLIEHAVQQLPPRITTLSLEVRLDNKPARALYERLGFTCDIVIPLYYGDGADAVRYRRAR
jgi:[ribosomal protein S18]-alanine N-acetyltransferase